MLKSEVIFKLTEFIGPCNPHHPNKCNNKCMHMLPLYFNAENYGAQFIALVLNHLIRFVNRHHSIHFQNYRYTY